MGDPHIFNPHVLVSLTAGQTGRRWEQPMCDRGVLEMSADSSSHVPLTHKAPLRKLHQQHPSQRCELWQMGDIHLVPLFNLEP